MVPAQQRFEAFPRGHSHAARSAEYDGAGEAMEIDNFEIVRIHESWSETLVRFITKISPLLMMIGLVMFQAAILGTMLQ